MGAWLFAFAVLVSPADTDAVQLSGVVTDSTGTAIRTAEVRLDSLPWKSVTASGRYEFEVVSIGPHALQVRALGYQQLAFPLNIGGGPTVSVDIELRRAAVLPEVVVRAPGSSPTSPSLPSGFLDRRAAGSGGTFLDRTEIAKRATSHTSELLRSIPGIALYPFTNEFGATQYNLVMRGITTVKGDICPLQYYLDGHPIEPDENIDRLITPEQIAAIEVYRGASQAPLQFRGPSARCGVVVIWSTQ